MPKNERVSWIESLRINAKKKAEAEMKAEAELAQQEEARRLEAEEMDPRNRRRSVSYDFLSQFLPIISQLQKDLHKDGYQDILGSKDGSTYGNHYFDYVESGEVNAYETDSDHDRDTYSSATWTLNYCMSVRLGDLGTLRLVPTGQDEDSLELCCQMDLPKSHGHETIHVSNYRDTQIVTTALQQLVGKSIEMLEKESLSKGDGQRVKRWSIFNWLSRS